MAAAYRADAGSCRRGRAAEHKAPQGAARLTSDQTSFTEDAVGELHLQPPRYNLPAPRCTLHATRYTLHTTINYQPSQDNICSEEASRGSSINNVHRPEPVYFPPRLRLSCPELQPWSLWLPSLTEQECRTNHRALVRLHNRH